MNSSQDDIIVKVLESILFELNCEPTWKVVKDRIHAALPALSYASVICNETINNSDSPTLYVQVDEKLYSIGGVYS